ncbi:hypothetical protein KI387_028407, partial [Taxus chinensis]
GNEEEEDNADDNNKLPPRNNINSRNPGGDKNNNATNANVNAPNQPENKKARLADELTNDIKRIIPQNFDGTTLGDGENWLKKMEYFAIRNISEETKA